MCFYSIRLVWICRSECRYRHCQELTHWVFGNLVDNIFKCIFFNENCCVLIRISLKSILKTCQLTTGHHHWSGWWCGAIRVTMTWTNEDPVRWRIYGSTCLSGLAAQCGCVITTRFIHLYVQWFISITVDISISRKLFWHMLQVHTSQSCEMPVKEAQKKWVGEK